MSPNTKGGMILALLKEGPATTGELKAELGWKQSLIAAHLCSLYALGHVLRTPYLGGRQKCYLWSIKEGAHG